MTGCRQRLTLGSCVLLTLLWAVSVHAAATFTWLRGTIDTWITTSTSLTSGSSVLSAAITIASAGYTRADCELNTAAWSTTIAANTAAVVWLIRQADGTNYEDGASGTDPARTPDIVFPLRPVSTAQRIVIPNIELPRGVFKALLKNDGTGATLQGTPWTLKCTPYILQSLP
jgi:hypothetical protein